MDDLINNIVYLSNKYGDDGSDEFNLPITKERTRGRPRKYVKYNNYKYVIRHYDGMKNNKECLVIVAVNNQCKMKRLYYYSRTCYEHEILSYMYNNKLSDYIPRHLYDTYKNNSFYIL